MPMQRLLRKVAMLKRAAPGDPPLQAPLSTMGVPTDASAHPPAQQKLPLAVKVPPLTGAAQPTAAGQAFGAGVTGGVQNVGTGIANQVLQPFRAAPAVAQQMVPALQGLRDKMMAGHPGSAVPQAMPAEQPAPIAGAPATLYNQFGGLGDMTRPAPMRPLQPAAPAPDPNSLEQWAQHAAANQQPGSATAQPAARAVHPAVRHVKAPGAAAGAAPEGDQAAYNSIVGQNAGAMGALFPSLKNVRDWYADHPTPPSFAAGQQAAPQPPAAAGRTPSGRPGAVHELSAAQVSEGVPGYTAGRERSPFSEAMWSPDSPLQGGNAARAVGAMPDVAQHLMPYDEAHPVLANGAANHAFLARAARRPGVAAEAPAALPATLIEPPAATPVALPAAATQGQREASAATPYETNLQHPNELERQNARMMAMLQARKMHGYPTALADRGADTRR